MVTCLPRRGAHPRAAAPRAGAPAPARWSSGCGHLRPAGVRRHRPGRLRDGGTGTGRAIRDCPRPADAGDHRPRGHRRRRHGGLADHPDRARRRSVRGRRSRILRPGTGRFGDDRLTHPPDLYKTPAAHPDPSQGYGTGPAGQRAAVPGQTPAICRRGAGGMVHCSLTATASWLPRSLPGDEQQQRPEVAGRGAQASADSVNHPGTARRGPLRGRLRRP